MSNGMPRSDIEALSYADLTHIHTAYAVGLTGPYKDYMIAYSLNPPYDKKSKVIPFDKIFKDVFHCLTLTDPSQMSDRDKKLKLLKMMGAPMEVLEKQGYGNTRIQQ